VLGLVLPSTPGAAAVKLPDLVFVRAGNLRLLSGSDRRETALTTTGDCEHPCWTPDGRALLYARHRGNNNNNTYTESRGDLWRLDLGTRSATRLTTSGKCFQPAVNPVTGEVWFVRPEHKERGDTTIVATLWSMGAHGAEPKWRANLDGFGSIGPGSSRWRPDGKMLAVEIDSCPEGGLVYYFDGSGRTAAAPVPDRGTGRVSPDITTLSCPAWQQGGRLLVRRFMGYCPGADPEFLSSFDVWDTVAKRIVRSIKPGGDDPISPPMGSRWCTSWARGMRTRS
jgi:hypothetical protein